MERCGLLLSSVAEQNEDGMPTALEPDEDGMFVEIALPEETEDLLQYDAEQNARDLRDTYLVSGAIPDDQDSQGSIGNDPYDFSVVGERFLQTDDTEDLNNDIHTGRSIVTRTRGSNGGSPTLSSQLAGLGTLLVERFSRIGNTDDLDEAVLVTHEAIDRTPKSNPRAYAIYLDCHAAALLARYSAIGAISDLQLAIESEREAIHIMPTHPTHSADGIGYLENLTTALIGRYLRTGAAADLEEAIHIFEELVVEMPADQTRFVRCLINYGAALYNRYLRTGAVCDLEQAIKQEKKAIEACTTNQAIRLDALHILGRLLTERQAISPEHNCLDEAAQLLREVVGLSSEDDQRRGLYLNGLAIVLYDRYERDGMKANLLEAISLHKHALHHTMSPIPERIKAGSKAIQYTALLLDWKQAYEVSRTVIDLLPELLPWLLKDNDKQFLLESVAGIACEAAAVALNAGEEPSVALQFLEQGRSLFAASVEQFRPYLGDLKKEYPELAEKFARFRNEFDQGGFSYDNPLNRHLFWQPATRKAFEASRRLQNMILQIRGLPGFDRFLQPPGMDEILSAAKNSPIVMINTGTYRCDALLIGETRIRSVPLPNLKTTVLQEKIQQGRLNSTSFLGWLWDALAKPVLDALGLTQAPPEDSWPRLYWIPTGALTQVPIHAAGRHSRGSSDTVLDRVISSYAISVKSIINGQNRRNMKPGSSKAVLVSMDHTPGSSSLPFAQREIAVVRKFCNDMGLHPAEPSPYFGDLMLALPNCTLFHFAGHGATNPQNPSRSHLLLGRDPYALDSENPSLMSVSNIRRLNIGNRQPFLAFLSACGTARVKNKSFVDEGIHLIVACQLMGFRHVIGTLWEVNDELCEQMARITYEMMRDGNMSDESVSLGLHKAARDIRNRWFDAMARGEDVGETGQVDETEPSKQPLHHGGQEAVSRRDIVALDSEESEDDEPPARLMWVPYVHYGI